MEKGDRAEYIKREYDNMGSMHMDIKNLMKGWQTG
jgi:hypothetical protein